MDYIPVDIDLPNHPKVLATAKALGLRPLDVWPRLLLLWIWCYRYSPGGDIIELFNDISTCRALLNFRSSEKTTAFIRGCITNRLLIDRGCNADRSLIVSGWFDNGPGSFLEQKNRKRQQWRELKQKQRSGNNKNVHMDNDTDKMLIDDDVKSNPLTPQKNKPPCPYEKLVTLYNDTRGSAQPEYSGKPDNALKRSLKSRWTEHPDLEWWKAYFGRCAGSDFLTGRKTNFVASLPWLIGPKNMSKVLGGTYENRKTSGAGGDFDFLETKTR